MISISERKAFYKSAIVNRKYKDAFLVAKDHYSDVFRKWRWKNGIVFRKNKISNETSKVVSEYCKLGTWVEDTERVINNCRNHFKVIPPNVSKETDTFRASGGKRLPWPDDGIKDFKDNQDAHAWHRLYWILDSDNNLALKYLWIWFDQDPDEIMVHPYTTSERINNLCKFIAVSSLSNNLQSEIINQIYKDANWLYDHVEIHLGIHNHVLNNASALCTAAYAFDGQEKSKLWIEKSRAIWDEFWPKLILEDGFFAEQSSFYHVLLTRTVLEYIMDAKLSDRTIPEKFLEKVKKMCSITNLLIRTDGTIPIYGDASPDIPMEWLRGLPEICKDMGLLDESVRDTSIGYAGGANRLMQSIPVQSGRKSPDLFPDQNWTCNIFEDSGFLFARNNKIDLELTAMGYSGKELHGHSDTGRGSYEIWWKERHIVVDGGIPEYGLSPEAVFFKGVQGQNSISLNGIAPTLLDYEADQLPGWYTNLQKPGEWKISSTEATFKWHGFYRYKYGLVWCRTWSWDDVTITVSDKILGVKGPINLEAYLHFGENDWIDQNEGIIKGENCTLCINTSELIQISLTKMPYSPNYGVIKDSLGVIVSGKVKLPFELEWKFKFSD